MQCPTFSAINEALRSVMVSSLAPYKAQLTIIPEAQEAGPNAAKILVLQAFKPSIVTGAELGGRFGYSRREGNFLVTLSIPKGEREKFAQAWTIAGALASAFRMLSLSCTGGGMAYTSDPYVTNAGITPDGRASIMLTVPWSSWTGGE